MYMYRGVPGKYPTHESLKHSLGHDFGPLGRYKVNSYYTWNIKYGTLPCAVQVDACLGYGCDRQTDTCSTVQSINSIIVFLRPPVITSPWSLWCDYQLIVVSIQWTTNINHMLQRMYTHSYTCVIIVVKKPIGCLIINLQYSECQQLCV